SEMRMFAVADQRSIPEIEIDTVIAVPCRELLLTEDVRDRAAADREFAALTDHVDTGVRKIDKSRDDGVEFGVSPHGQRHRI
ncbi:hypothetical protein C6A85_13720, partial [Mycobacterium sp. ITM-2017-0098]